MTIVNPSNEPARDFGISLHVRHPIDDLKLLASILKLERFRSWKKGEPRKTPKGTLLEGTSDHSYCCLRVTIVGGELPSACIERFVAGIETVKAAVLELCELKASGGSISLVVTDVGDGGLKDEFNSDLLHAMGRLGINLGLEIG